MTNGHWIATMALATGFGVGMGTWAPAAAPVAAGAGPAGAAATQPANAPTSDEVLKDLLGARREAPVIAPQPEAGVPVGSGPVTTGVLDPRILGVAPGQEPPTLRREGEFIISRRGRIVRVGAQAMFAFDGDGRKSPEPPMFLLPCGKLQDMEEIAKVAGDQVVFIVTGQVFVYRGANYLLPTMSSQASDKGNLKQ